MLKLGVLISGILLCCAAVEGAEEVVRLLSPELRRIEARLGEVAKELETLPVLRERPFASRFGFRSGNLVRENEEHWVRIDLGQVEEITRIVAVPVNVPAIGERGAGYGFPKRFRIEVADNAEMEGAVTVVDMTGEDFPNPGRYPVNFPMVRVKGRYVKFTSTRHFPVEEGFIWALEELFVLSGNRMPSVSHDPDSSSSLEVYPNWALVRLNDGHSALGMAMVEVKSPRPGYLSGLADHPNEKKHLTVDLGREYAIDEVRLLPVKPENFEHDGSKSFPRGFRVMLAKDAGFQDVTWGYTFEKTNLVGFPGECTVVYSADGKRGRYLRLETTELWGEPNGYGYSLAEIQAYSGDENVALGKVASTSDESDIYGWSASAVVDGYGSESRLVEMPEYLDLIARRGFLEKERDGLMAKRADKLRMFDLAFAYGGGAVVVAAGFAWVWMILRQRNIREKAVGQLRDQIARDLHDDIGSNLGGIVLISEIGNAQSSDPLAREDFRVIKEAADEAAASMRDIVWLTGRNSSGLREFISKMRQSVQLILGDRVAEVTVVPEVVRDRVLSLLFRRHVLYSFKEALNNVRKHSDAKRIEVEIRVDAKHLTFWIRDEGVGFDPRAAEFNGHGLANLRRRAERLGGSVRIESTVGEGSFVTFSAPLKS